jgi:hypothetical protein
MSQPSGRLRRLGRHVASIFTGLAAGPRDFTPRFDRAREAPVGKGEDETAGPRRRTEAAPGREGDEPPWRHADAAPREAATGEAEQAREEAAGRPAASPLGDATPAAAATFEPAAPPDPPRSAGARPDPGTPKGASPATTAATEEAAQTAAATPEDAKGSAAAATEEAARSEQGSGARANPAAPQDLAEGLSPADVRRGIAQESRRPGDSRGGTARAPEPPPRGAAPRHGQVGDLRNRVDQVVNDQARIAQQLLQLSDQARAAWRAAQEVTRQLRQVNRNALKR